MSQKKKTNKKSNNKKHMKQNKNNVIYQTIPNYSSSQITGHQYNKNKVQFAPAVHKNQEQIIWLVI